MSVPIRPERLWYEITETWIFLLFCLICLDYFVCIVAIVFFIRSTRLDCFVFIFTLVGIETSLPPIILFRLIVIHSPTEEHLAAVIRDVFLDVNFVDPFSG
ncbi:hypothetical protein F5882DRAFT_392349 [Hyaloscypha sp. PMI_1271]|nr:hypothetical protein F5882DRAFT_392349 [Hyaloscypha sp. PMI_1271]